MKKTLLLLTLTSIVIVSLTSCSFLKKERKSVDDFKQVAKSESLKELEYEEDSLEKNNSAYENMAAFCDENETYQVEFYDMDSIDSAYTLYDNLNAQIERSYGDRIRSKTSANSLNYDMQTYAYSDSYFFVERVEDTILFGYTLSVGKEPIKLIVENLGY